MTAAVEESWVLVGACVHGTWRARRYALYRCGEVATVAADAKWALRREEMRG
jgi:uncharacterized protein YaiE (UPF0345 family)